MLKALQGKGVVWLRLGIVTAVVLSFLGSALAMSQELDQNVLHAKHSSASVADTGVSGTGGAGDDPAQTAQDTKCHIGDGCIPMIMPGNGLLETARVDGAPEPRRATDGKPSRAGYPLFHPPRTPSQV